MRIGSLTKAQERILKNLADGGGRDIAAIQEPYRRAALDLAWLAPPLVAIDDGIATITEAGHVVLAGE